MSEAYVMNNSHCEEQELWTVLQPVFQLINDHIPVGL